MRASAAPGPFTVVSFHAHPDDEALLTSGTLARAVAEGHRVVLVVATGGEAGLCADGSATDLAQRRLSELRASARAIGAGRVEVLGHADSGAGPMEVRTTGDHRAVAGPGFAHLDPGPVAQRVAQILREERADVLTIYDPAGGYGHRDHVQVHRVGMLAAQLAGTPVVLEATLDRTTVVRVVAVLRLLSRVLPMPRLPDMSTAYTARSDLTHRIDVRRQLPAKRASLAAHGSQTEGGPRTIRLLLGLPGWLQRRVLGHESYREVGRPPSRPLADDIFATLRSG